MTGYGFVQASPAQEAITGEVFLIRVVRGVGLTQMLS